MNLELPSTRLVDVRLQPNEDGGKAVINVSAPITPQLADKLKRREMLYTEEGFARDFEGSIKIGLSLSSDWQFPVEAEVDDQTFSHVFNVEKMRNFAFSHSKEKEDQDSRLRLNFSVHVVILSEVDNAYRLWSLVGKNVFDCQLRSRQGELFDVEGQAPESEEPEEG